VEQAPAQAVGRPSGRYWEIDAARTVAIAMMVAYHTVYDLHVLSPGLGVDPFGPPWRPLQVATGSSFLAIAGLSFWLSSARARAVGLRGVALWRKHARRAAELIAWGVAISVVTLVALGEDGYVRFGILHLIGAAILLGPLVARLGVWNAALGAAAIAAGLVLKGERSEGAWLLVLGVRPEGGAGVDYYPLLPWLGPFLAGLALGALLYPGGTRGAWGRRLPVPRGSLPVAAPGRHSLAVYLVHQPVLIGLLAAGLALAGAEVGWR
jgi:uncharacterized membrane protein